MLSRLFRKRPPALALPPPRPDAPVEVVGDIHGCARLLQALPSREAGATRVYVGDYVDRGPDSRAVLEQVHAEAISGEAVCLMGNHEAMLLRFLQEPDAMRRWLRFGGLQTLASYGIGGITETAEPARLADAATAMSAAMSFDLGAWLSGLPVLWSSGTLAVAHAGLDPMLPLDAQPPETAIWGNPDFGTVLRPDGIWVAHGHTIVAQPRADSGVISVDTGAYASGRLTLARIAPDGAIEFAAAESA